MTAAPIATLEGVSFSYRGAQRGADPYGAIDRPTTEAAQPALQDVDLTLSPGTLTLLCGASGSGKSTVLQVLNGLVPQFHVGRFEGCATVDGRPLARMDLNDIGLLSATVFQNPRTQFFTARVAEEIAFCLENRGVPCAQMQARVASASQLAGVGELVDRALAGLSGGQAQRVACACAAAADVGLILLDEPTSNLSPQGIEELRDVVQRFKEQGKTLLVAEHRLHWLNGLVDQVCLVEEGRIVERLEGHEFFALSPHQCDERGLRTLVPPQWHRDPQPLRTDGDASGLHLRSVRFSYGKQPVLAISEHHFDRGKVHVVTGANGVGKTTLVRALCGLIRCAGEIQLDGRPLSAKQRMSRSSLVMQDVNRQLFAESALREITLGTRGVDHAQAGELLGLFDLESFAERHPQTLSGGQKQRLAIATALASQKQVLIFDEPTSGVDNRHMLGVAAQLRRMAEQGHVVVVVTHDAELAQACADVIHTLTPCDPNGALMEQLVAHAIVGSAPPLRNRADRGSGQRGGDCHG